MYHLPFAWRRRNSCFLVITGLAALAMCGCPRTGPGNGNDNQPPPECGDGVVDTSETCDDGNTVNGDGCSSTCQMENEPPRENTCGDGVVGRSEQCDDGNTVNGDGCSSTCQRETPAPPRCGDGVKNGTEQCDAGGETQTCNANCTNTRCGDGIVNLHAGEQCDDRNTVNEDGCSSICRNETPPPPGCVDGVVNGTEQCDGGGETATCNINCTTSRCGDAIVNTHAGEQCDDGNTVNGDGCSLTCQIETGGGGGGGGTTRVCGNGRIETGEQCDDGNTANGDGCSSTCQSEPGGPLCGDNVVSGTEECDDGNNVDTDACTNTCQNAVCGDGIVRAGVEQCDDGNTANGDGCSSTCQSEPGAPICGDNVVSGTEECDDGNNVDTDACTNTCQNAVCGDGIVRDGVEQCDDGNAANGDGCSSTCQNEAGGIPNELCSAPIDVTDGTQTYSNVGATTDGPDEPATCVFEFGNTSVDADIWYCYTASCTGTALVSLCGSAYDTRLAVYAGCGCPTAAPLDCSDDDCGTGAGNVQSRVTFTATTGQPYLVRVGGYLGEQGNGRLTIGCNVDACANGTESCFEAKVAPGCGDAACCASTCGLDQFCCDVTWDASCAGEAQGVCTGNFPACAPGSGSCGVQEATPGCESVDCCNTVCGVDPFCCLDKWDGVCVDEAESMCFLTCGPGAGGGDCHSVNATPGCNSQTCCEAVCADDPFCCETNWDQTCVTAAAAFPTAVCPR